MKHTENNEAKIFNELTKLFGAESESYQPDEEELQFIDERDKLEKKVQWSFEKYTEHYELLKTYGLDFKLINELEWFIVFELEHNKEDFLKSLFYQKFKHHEVVQSAFSEYERQMELK